jgi:signal peptidase II
LAGAVAGGVLALDLATKWLLTYALTPGEPVWLVRGVLGLELRENSGVAFSLLPQSRLLPLLLPVAVVALAWVGWQVWRRHPSWMAATALGAVAAGALGNLVDRLGDGAVTDFVAVGPWPRFNVADAALTCGIAALVVASWRAQEDESGARDHEFSGDGPSDGSGDGRARD